MVRLKTFFFLGQSNMAGLAGLSGVTNANFSRWTGQNTPTPITATLPVDIQIPGINLWQAQMPYATETAYTNTNWLTTTTVELTGTTLALNQYAERWCVVTSGTVGAGATQVRKIVSNTDVLNSVITIDGATPWSPQPTDGLRLSVLTSSMTLTAGSTTTRLLTNAASDDFVAGDVGKWVVIISGAIIYQAAKITAFNGATDVTVDPPLTAAPASGVGIVVLRNSGAQSIATYTGRFFPLNYYYGASPAYTTGYDYPNIHSTPLSAPILHTATPVINPLSEATWQLRQYHTEDVWCIHLALGSTYISTFRGQNGAADFAWFENNTHNDWHPGSTDQLTVTPTYDLFDVLFTTVLGAAQAWVTANRPGDLLDVQGFFTMVGESDATESERAQLAGVNMALLRDTARSRASAYSTLPAAKLPWIIGLVRTTSNVWTYGSTVNEHFEQLARDDPYTGAVNTNSLTVSVSDTAHYDAPGQIAFGEALVDKWQAIRYREGDPTRPLEERPTLSAIRTQVLRRYEGQSASNDASTNRLNQFINDSLREVNNTLGDNAWFLRRTEALTTSAVFPSTLTAPRAFKRLLWIESQSCPGRKIVWKGISLTDQGRMQITLHDAGGSPYIAHFVQIPSDLSTDSDAALIPQDYVELVVTLTCKRLCETHGNAAMASYYNGEVQRLWKYVKKDVLRYARMAQEALTTVDAYDPWSNGVTGSGFRES